MRLLGYKWVILTTGLVILFFNGGSRFAFGLMLKPMADEFGWSRSSLSLALTMFMLVSALGMPLAGRLVDRYSLRWILAAGVLSSATGIGMMGMVSARWQVFLLYGVLYALGHASTSVVSVGVMVSRWFVQSQGIANSVAISGNALGQLVIITALASLLSSLGWRTSYAMLGTGIVVILLPLVLATLRSRSWPGLAENAGPAPLQAGDRFATTRSFGSGRPTTQFETSINSILASRRLWLLAVVYACCGFQDFFVATHVVAFATDRGMGTLLAGNLLALMGLMGLIGVLISGVLADALGPARPAALCFLIRIGIFLYIIYVKSTFSIVVFALLYGFTFLITAPLVVVFARSIFGMERLGIASGLLGMVHQVAGGLGAFVGGLIFDRFGTYDWAFVMMLGLAVLANATTLLLWEPRARAVRQA